jgi:pimeloyl-ACP methyl ester carboxylesterase
MDTKSNGISQMMETLLSLKDKVKVPSVVDHVLLMDFKRRGFRSHRIELKHCELHYLEWTPPKNNALAPLVLVHGIGANATHWHHLTTFLMDAGHPIVIPDLPAHGKSTDPTQTFDPKLLHALFAEFMSRVVPAPSILVGNSLGGGVVLRFALENPDRWKGTVALSPAGGFETQEEWETFRLRFNIQTAQDAAKLMRQVVPVMPPRVQWSLPLIHRDLLRSLNREGVRQLIEETRASDFGAGESAKRLRSPVLLIWGKREELFPQKNLEWFKRNLIGKVKIEEPSDPGHCPQLDSPEWLAKRLREFISEVQNP